MTNGSIIKKDTEIIITEAIITEKRITEMEEKTAKKNQNKKYDPSNANEPERKKIFHLTFCRDGGVSVYLRNLIKYSGDEFDTSLVGPEEYRDLPCGFFPISAPRKISVFADIKAAVRLRRLLKKERPDVLYCHSSIAGGVGRIAALGLKCKTVYNPHGWSFNMTVLSPLKRTLYVWTERFFSGHTDKIIVISEYEKSSALREKICREDKLCVILSGTDTELLSSYDGARDELGFDGNNFVVGCAARIVKEKNPLLFADIAREIIKRCPDARFVWVGDGDMCGALEERLRENGIADKTVITGWTDIPGKYISAFDVGLTLSAWEGFGLCSAEYLACGKPVVATAVGANPEIINSKSIGRCLDTLDPAEFAEAVLSFRGKNCSAECRASAARFDIRRTARETDIAVKELV